MRTALIATLLSTATVAVPAFAAESTSPAEFAGDISADAPDAAAITARCNEYVAEVEARLAALENRTGPHTIEGTLRAYDELNQLAYYAGAEMASFSQSMDTEEKRDAASACDEPLSAVGSKIGLSRPIYEHLKAIDASAVDAVTQRYLADEIGDYERAGVNLPEDKREQVRLLREELSRIGTQFSRNYAKARGIVLALPEELDGLPADFIASHPPQPDGLVRISTDGTDFSAVMTYARNDSLREKLARLYYSRAFPENAALLGQIFTKRQELAELLGRPNYAALQFEPRMLNTVEKVDEHLAELATASLPAAERDMALLREIFAKERPGKDMTVFDYGYAAQLAVQQRFDLNPQEVRQYFTYDNVREGIFELTQDLFQIEIRPWDTKLWHPDVEAFQIFENGELRGGFYLDSHPRPGKYQHANHIALRKGVEGRSLPVSVLTMNLPKGGYDTGLMEHGQVETFLHEFGHLLHSILGGRTQWFGLSGVANERDFTEAPSQMLEEWVYDYDTLARFARNEAGEVIPRELVEKMQAARWFGNGYNERVQLGFSNASLNFHRGAPEDASAEAISQSYRDWVNAYPMLDYPHDTHRESSFGHLDGYAAGYYTYGWSRVIAADMFARFEAEGLRNPETAMAYRRLVLEPGGSKPSAELIEDFLGRPVNTDAFRRRLEGE